MTNCIKNNSVNHLQPDQPVKTTPAMRLATYICRRIQYIPTPTSYERHTATFTPPELTLLFNKLVYEATPCAYIFWLVRPLQNSTYLTRFEEILIEWQKEINGQRFESNRHLVDDNWITKSFPQQKIFQIIDGAALVCDGKPANVLDEHGNRLTKNPWKVALESDQEEDFAEAKELQPYPIDTYQTSYTSRNLAKSVGWFFGNYEKACSTKNFGIASYLLYYPQNYVAAPSPSDAELYATMAKSLEGSTEKKILKCCESQNFGIAEWLVDSATEEELAGEQAKGALRIAVEANQTLLRDKLVSKKVVLSLSVK